MSRVLENKKVVISNEQKEDYIDYLSNDIKPGVFGMLDKLGKNHTLPVETQNNVNIDLY